MIALTPTDVLRCLYERTSFGDTVLVTLVSIEGSSSRALGTVVAVTERGEMFGSLAGGCIDGAIVAEAREVLIENRGRVVRYGQGSRYFDVRLPCGGGIDLLFTPKPNPHVLALALAELADRREVQIAITRDGVSLHDEASPSDAFVLLLAPSLRVAAIGQGDDLFAFARLAARFGLDTTAVATQEHAVNILEVEPCVSARLARRDGFPLVGVDRWTAVVFLFHDHSWEEMLIPWALAHPAFYIGAVGSHRTHRARVAMLAAAGVSPERIRALRGSIGVFPATRDPASLAISVLAEIVAEFAPYATRPLDGALYPATIEQPRRADAS